MNYKPTTMKRKIDLLLDEYGESHQNNLNKTIHWICVPAIFWSIVALIYSIPPTFLTVYFGTSLWVNWATVILIFVLFYYTSFSVYLSIGMAVFGASCIYIAQQADLGQSVPLPYIALSVFTVAWIGQFYGHYVEGKKPSFFKDLQFLLIGPAWLLHFIYKKLGIPY